MKYLLLLDYDGTLTPIRKRPELALLAPRRREFLRRLARRPNIKIAIISGRRLAEIKMLVNIPGLVYVGNHGFEIEIGRRTFIRPAARRFAATLKKIKAALSVLRSIKGVIVEDKRYALSVHFRLVPAGRLKYFRGLFLKALRRWRRKVKITSGKKVFEIRPPVDWDKGKAVKWLVRELKPGKYRPVYIGDDRTDEDAFRALKGVGLSYKVGKGGKSRADDRLGNVADVYRLLSNYVMKGECTL